MKHNIFSFRPYIFLFSILMLFAACNNSSKKSIVGSDDSIPKPLIDSIFVDTTQIDSMNSFPSKAIELKSNWDSIKLHKISKESDTITFKSNTFKGINAEIISVKTGNIRINQIILPDMQSDGPFGKELDYSLDKNGDYKLIIGESLMQGDPFEGDYILKFKGK